MFHHSLLAVILNSYLYIPESPATSCAPFVKASDLLSSQASTSTTATTTTTSSTSLQNYSTTVNKVDIGEDESKNSSTNNAGVKVEDKFENKSENEVIGKDKYYSNILTSTSKSNNSQTTDDNKLNDFQIDNLETNELLKPTSSKKSLGIQRKSSVNKTGITREGLKIEMKKEQNIKEEMIRREEKIAMERKKEQKRKEDFLIEKKKKDQRLAIEKKKEDLKAEEKKKEEKKIAFELDKKKTEKRANVTSQFLKDYKSKKKVILSDSTATIEHKKQAVIVIDDEDNTSSSNDNSTINPLANLKRKPSELSGESATSMSTSNIIERPTFTSLSLSETIKSPVSTNIKALRPKDPRNRKSSNRKDHAKSTSTTGSVANSTMQVKSNKVFINFILNNI